MMNVYSSNTFYPKLWTGSDGEKSLVPKDEGKGIMISFFSQGNLVLDLIGMISQMLI